MEIDMGKLPFDIDFHPSNPLVTAGLITGHLLLYQYGADSPPQRLLEVHAHSESCRAVRFINEGRGIVTGSPDCSILATDVETGSAIARLENSHGAAVNRIINLTESTIASGDDEGCIKVWDTRQRTCSNSFNAHEEYISDMTFAFDSMRLLGTSGDGSLSVCNLRSNKIYSLECSTALFLQTRSEFSEDELLSVIIMTNGRKVICGTQTGTLLLYSWGFFKDCSDCFVDLSPNSVDALLKLDEDRVISGSENGLISLVGILPNRIIQPIAEHSEYPVERLAFSHDKKFLGSISHDHTLKLWDMDNLLLSSGSTIKSHLAVAYGDSHEMDEMDMDRLPKSSKGTKRKIASRGQGLDSSNNFFADL
ncbi:WD repeat-containing protein 55 [Camellia lanceoleosa]|uniref:WD repeat-containing protein 55 n=1 Tax=Camellia lanceoleosa TaxID=1840588 RepID=A0ACC0J390_9ERIC|nr:WD repeat-containing protein 55 [Camellia lanceoleosa]